MSGNASVFQTSGGGYDYEHYVQSAFLLTMILNGSIPIFPENEILEIGFQCKNKGYQTDDLFVKVDKDTGCKILIQIKYNIAISENNETFIDVITSFWKDFNNSPLFEKQKDKFFLIKSSLTNSDKNHIIVLSEWASTHSSEDEFYSEVERIKVKKEKLGIFENVLKKANDDVELSKKEVWEFLKCFHLLSYDFTTQSSTNQTQMLNLIKLSKSKLNSTLPLEIWNTIIAKTAEFNRNGGNVTSENIGDLQLHRFFDSAIIDDSYKAIEKLKSDGDFILKPIKNSIEGFRINRTNIKSNVIESFNRSKITFITGSPGVGKSAILKDILTNEYKNFTSLIFKADQFNKSTIAQIFNDIGIKINISDILNSIALVQKKLIVIDSAEKLLEGDSESAFNQLLSILNDIEDLHLVLTSRSYAVNIISQKFNIDKKTITLIEIPLLSNEEMDLVQNNFRELQPLINHKDIREVLRSPKYLEFALNSVKKETIDSNEINLSDFKNMLWNQIIENYTVICNGLARKRRKTFLHIAVGRAKSMSLYFSPNDNEIDYEALDKLINDDVLVKNKSNDAFSPSHDILEDWALVKHIDFLNRNSNSIKELFDKLGNQPAFRRAFRLWVEDLISNDINVVIDLVKETRTDKTIERYWEDEVLTSIFRSEKCDIFFEVFKNELLEANHNFLLKCVLVIRTTCREYVFNEFISKDTLFPVGSGWKEVLYFISNNVQVLDNLRNSIVQLLLDWEYRYLFEDEKCSQIEIESSYKILFHYILQMEAADNFWNGYNLNNQKKQLVFMLFGFSNYLKNEIQELLERCNNRTNEYGRLYDFDELVIKKALGGIRNQKLVEEIPDLLIELANKHWKDIQIEIDEDDFGFPSTFEKDESWGVKKYGFDFFPAGVYKTFIYNLLLQNPIKGIKFVVEFTNYMTTSYKDSEYGAEDEIEEITIIHNDDTKTIQYGNLILWCAYRGTVVTNDLLESILISLEKYLFELTKLQTEENKILQTITSYSLKNSNSVATTSVLVSAFISNPKPFGNSVLPILKTKQFYMFDSDRAIRESGALSVADSQIPYAQKEKWKSNQLPHRTRYRAGLRTFIFEYQFHIGDLNNELIQIFDKFYEECKDDIIWEKIVREMDVRKYKSSIADKEKGIIQFEVDYTKEIKQVVQQFEDSRKDENAALSHAGLVHKVQKEDYEISIEEWLSAYEHFSSTKTEVSMFDKPVSTAVIGLEKLRGKLNKEQKQWCLLTIFETLKKIGDYIFWRSWYYNSDFGFNHMELEITTQSIHLLYQNITDVKDLHKVDVIVCYFLISPMADHERRTFLKYYLNVLSEKFPEKVIQLNLVIAKYAGFVMKNHRPRFNDSDELTIFLEKENKFINDCLTQKNINIDINELNFSNYRAYYLMLNLLMISHHTENEFQRTYILVMLDLIFEDLRLKKTYSWINANKGRQIGHMLLLDLRFWFSKVLFFNSLDFAKIIIDKFIEIILNEEYSNKDSVEFITEIIDFPVTLFDDVIVENDEDKIQKYGDQFWNLWQYIFKKVKGAGEPLFVKQLLLDSNNVGWSIKSSNWSGFMNKKTFYEEMIDYFGDKSMKHIINVFSSFGEKLFLPNDISWLIKFLKDDPSNRKHLNSTNAIKLIQLLFNNHINEIKKNQKLVSEYIYLLNVMVNLEHSEAYLIRECVITYKAN